MDTSDPDITFDDAGICNHCLTYDAVIAEHVVTGEAGRQRMREIADSVRRAGRGKPYDCIIGVSGGVDSTYVAYLVRQLDLRPLAVHLDNGWNSERAVRNIENTINRLGIDLYTEVLDWEEFRSLQVAFLKASTPDSEIPTDHAIVAALYRAALRHRVGYLIMGSNYATELKVPLAWSNGHGDWRYIDSIYRQFAGRRLARYPHYTFLQKQLVYRVLREIKEVNILNFLDYDKFEVMETLKRELDWVPYKGKHYESIYTRFYQGYILPRKFGFDKRRAHLSCLISGGRISRDQALAEIQQPPLDEEQAREDRDFILKKLRLSSDEFEAIMAAPAKRFQDYPSYERLFRDNRYARATYGTLRATYRAFRSFRSRAKPAAEPRPKLPRKKTI